MRFKEFLNEAPAFNFEKFTNDCSFFFDQLKGSKGKHLMYRGVHHTPKDVTIETWKARTGPRDSSSRLHSEMNEFFQSHLGAPIRDWTFASGSENDANIYSDSYDIAVIFPIGKFEWVSADNQDGHDLTGFYDRCMSAIRNQAPLKDLPYDDKISLAIDMMKHKMEKWDWRMNADFLACLRDENEIMFKCDKYYVFNKAGKTFKSAEMTDLLKHL